MPRRTFDLPSPEEGEPVEIEVAYKRKDDDGAYHAETQEFVCMPFLPAAALRYVGLAANDTLAAVAFIERCITTDDDADRFLNLVNDRDIALRGEELGDIFQWLSSTYAARPTRKPSPLGDGPPSTGPILTDAAPSPDQT